MVGVDVGGMFATQHRKIAISASPHWRPCHPSAKSDNSIAESGTESVSSPVTLSVIQTATQTDKSWIFVDGYYDCVP